MGRDIRLIALDLDGTLLTTDKRLTKRTVRTLSEAAGRGIRIVPATGRSLTGLSPKIRELPFIRYAITVNGAAVWDMGRQEPIVRRAFSTERAVELWEFIARYHAVRDVCIDGIARMEPEYYNKVETFMPDEPRRMLIRSTRTPTEGLGELVADGSLTVEKFNLFFREDAEAVRQQARRDLAQFDGLSVTSSLGNNLEINHADATKGRGLLAPAAHLGLSPEQTMAFGDGENVVSMLRAAGLGVAMGNAAEEVKAAADLVTLGNDEDGVAYGIEKYVLTGR